MRDCGRIRIIESTDGDSWGSAALLSQPSADLRDPKLVPTADGRLLLLAGATRIQAGKYVGRRPYAWLSSDGRTWSAATPLLSEGDWLWRITLFRGRYYGVTYRLLSAGRWEVWLVASVGGLVYEEVCRLAVPGKPNEATVRFRAAGEAVAIVRREAGKGHAWVGRSRPPYRSWKWKEVGARLGGPNLVILPNGEEWVAARFVAENQARTCIGQLTPRGLHPKLLLPSDGDCGYPGLVWHRRRLWVSYYSSHEGKAAIYLARVAFEPPFVKLPGMVPKT